MTSKSGALVTIKASAPRCINRPASPFLKLECLMAAVQVNSRIMTIAVLWFGLLMSSIPGQTSEEGVAMSAALSAIGTFEVNLSPQEDAETPAGRMLISKSYRGGMEGSGAGQMISKMLDSGTAVYYAIEEFSGSVMGKSGGFTLVHQGHMDKESQSLEVKILEGSGSGELEAISGSMTIVQDEGGHSYTLQFEL